MTWEEWKGMVGNGQEDKMGCLGERIYSSCLIEFVDIRLSRNRIFYIYKN